MKRLLFVLITLTSASPSLARQCCKDNNHNSCDTHRICPAGTSELCEGACLPDTPKTTVTQQTTRTKKAPHKHVKKHKKHHTYRKHIKHHNPTVH